MSDFEIFDLIKEIEYKTGVDIRIKNRKRKYVYSRSVFFDILRKENPKMTLSKIGNFVNMDHSSVIHWINTRDSVKKYDDYIDIEREIKSIKRHENVSTLIFCNPITYPYDQN